MNGEWFAQIEKLVPTDTDLHVILTLLVVPTDTLSTYGYWYPHTRSKRREESLKSEPHHTEAIRHRFIAWNGMNSSSEPLGSTFY